MSVVTRFVDCANHHDAEGLTACVHRDFESVQPFHPGRNFRGSGQLRSNWQAIFDSEPGFRLTVLRSAIAGDTVWVELHGAGEEAEVSGVFVVGVENGRIRWIRVYSELVDEVPEEAEGEEAEAAAAAGLAVVGVPTDSDTGDADEDAEGDAVPDETAPAALRLVRDDPEGAVGATPEQDDAATTQPAADPAAGPDPAGDAVVPADEADEVEPESAVAAEEPTESESEPVALVAADAPEGDHVVVAGAMETGTADDRAIADAREAKAASAGDESLDDSDLEPAAEDKPKWKSALRAMFGRVED